MAHFTCSILHYAAESLFFSTSILQLFEYHEQSYYIEVVQGDIFMEQKMRFGLVLGWFAILKKNWGPIMSNF